MTRRYFTPEVGQRVACTISPNADGSLDTGEITEVRRQTFTADIVRVDWDREPNDRDWYSTEILELVA